MSTLYLALREEEALHQRFNFGGNNNFGGLSDYFARHLYNSGSGPVPKMVENVCIPVQRRVRPRSTLVSPPNVLINVLQALLALIPEPKAPVGLYSLGRVGQNAVHRRTYDRPGEGGHNENVHLFTQLSKRLNVHHSFLRI